MKKHLYRFSVLFFSVMLCFGIFGITANAESIDNEKSASLKIVYANGGVSFEGLEVQLYRVAAVKDGYTFQLEAPFNKYSVNINDVKSQEEWRSVAITLSSYAIADGLTPTAEKVTDKNGVAEFTNLRAGMYLTIGIREQTGKDFVVFEDFLTVIPYPADDGESYLYDLTAYPKCKVITPRDGTVPYKVIKQWKDDEKTKNRPKSVKIEIFKNGKLNESVTLTAENNWMYSWRVADDGSNWRVVERDVPSGYFVNVSEQETAFVVTNSADESFEKPNPPKTGDTTVVWPYIVAMCVSGCLLIILAIGLKRKS